MAFSLRSGALGLSAVFTALALAPSANAAGLYFSDRGVRPLGRGGAFVAGADDVGAIWYNPAGLADAGTSVLVDASWLNFKSTYTRQTQVADSSGTLRTYNYPTVHGTSPVLPLPTIGVSYNFGDKKQYTAAFGIIAPYTAITTYPLTVDGQPSPSRYALVSLDGSALVVPGLYMSWKPLEQIRIGAGVQAIVGTFASETVFSASPPDRLISAPEDPQYDALSQLKVGPIFAPSANFGTTLIPEKHVRIGLAYQLPFFIDAPATVDVRLPSAPVFDNAQQVGDKAHVAFALPPIFRAGIEVRQELGNGGLIRVEGSYVREFWTVQHSIDIRPDNIQLVGVTGFPSPYAVSPISIPRNYDNSNSFRVGGELTVPIAGYFWDFRLGANYDGSAIPRPYLSALTVDLPKYTVTGGLGLHLNKHWRFDALYAHVFAKTQTVSPAEAAIPRINPVQGNPTMTEAINGGTYSAKADVVGVGLNYKF